jgi:hypothetical protein
MICKFVTSIGGADEFNLNDSTSYWVLNDSEFPLPEIIYNEVENSLEDGVRVANWRIGGRKITLKIYIKGTSGADLKSKRDALFRQLLKPGILEVRGWDEDASVFYTTQPTIPKMPDYWKKYIKDIHRETDVTVEIPVEPTVRTALESLTLFENLAPNADCEDWTVGEPDGWTVTDGWGSSVEEETTIVWHGSSSMEFTRSLDDCYATTTEFITVDATHQWQFDAFAIDSAESPNLKLFVLCYDVGSNLLGTLTIADAAPSPTWYQHACKYDAAKGVIEPGDWPVGTTKVKLKIENSGDSSTLHVDQIIFGDTEYIPNHRMEAAVSFVVPPAEFEGVVPADMNVYLDNEFWQPYAVFLGQRKNYHASFNGVREPTEVTPQDLNVCLGQGYEEYTPLANLVLTPGFEAPGGFAEDNTDAFTNWTITRTTTTGTAYIGATNDINLIRTGTWALVFGSGDPSNKAEGYAVSDKFVVDGTHDYYWELYPATLPGTVGATLKVTMYFYSVADALLGTKVLYSSVLPSGRPFLFGDIYASDLPAATAKFAMRIDGKVQTDSIGIDDVTVYDCSTVLGQSDFDLEAHEGNYLDLALVSCDSATDEDNIIDLQAQVVSDSLGAITAVYSRSSVDIGNPNTEWVCTALVSSATWDKSITPVSNVHSQADLSTLSERIRLLLPQEFDTDAKFWLDFIARIPVDRAVVKLVNLVDEEYLIIGNEGAFVSLDGTVDTATTVEPSKTSPPSAPFKADPDGINLVLVALYDNSGSYEPRPIMDVKLTYYPAYLL